MRIRNRPAPSVFPLPPDPNLNRRSSFPYPSAPPQILQTNASAASTTRHVSANDYIALDHQPAASTDHYFTRLRRPGKLTPKTVLHTTAPAADVDDNNANSRTIINTTTTTTTIWKNGSVEDDTEVHTFSHTSGVESKGAAVKRGSSVVTAATEGSRCSRVNGRGWRCGQQTLVGYSLCEHHLGKSRLRSFSSVKNNVSIGSKDSTAVALSGTKIKILFEESDDDYDKPLLISGGRKKSRIGTVKARSLSSLLDQTSQTNGASSKPSPMHKRNADY